MKKAFTQTGGIRGMTASKAVQEEGRPINIPRQRPMKKIRENCLECSGGQYLMVRYCQSTKCPFWYLRFGKMPETILNKGGVEAQELLNPDNFKDGAVFGSDKDIESLKPKKHRE